MHYFRGLWRRIGLAIFVIGLALSPNVWMSAKVLRLAGEGTLAEYRLSLIRPETYAREIGTALDTGDGDLARSLVALAADRKVAIPDELAVRVAALPPFDPLNALGQGWNCIVNGDFDSEAGFACVVATDLTGIGDARDLIGEGTHYLTGQPVNYLTLGVASVGLTLTAATVATGGGMLPLRAGASFVKGMNKAAKLPPKLVAELGGVLARGINGPALDETLLLARSFRFGELGRPLGRLFNPKSVKVVSELATDFGTIGKVGGVRAMKLSAGVAESTRDVKVLAKTATRFQDRFLGVMKLVGRGAVRLADLLWTLGGWLVGAVLWLLSMAWFMLKTVTRTARFGGRLMKLAIRRAAMPRAAARLASAASTRSHRCACLRLRCSRAICVGMSRTIKVDLFSDVVCPWCLIGAARLDKAFAELPGDIRVDVENHPFYLDPNTPSEGYDVATMLREKYGREPKAIWARAEEQAKLSGIDLDLSKQPRTFRTAKAHTIIRLAREKGTQHALANAIAAAYFLEQRPVNEDEVLAGIASEHGFTREEALSDMRDAKELAVSHQLAVSAAEQGIRGVPFFVFDNRFALSGAQPQEVFKLAFEKALEPAA